MTEPRVSVIIATWNAGDVLGACLDTVLRQQVEGGFETLVVDNASTDDTKDVLRGYADRVDVISNAHNAFYAGANNQAADVARGRVLFFLNSDTELIGDDVLELIARAAEDPQVAIVGPLLLNPDGTVQPSCAAHPTVSRALVSGVGLHRLLPDRVLAVVSPSHWSHDRPIDTDWVMGAAIGVRAELFRELGGFWETLYAEEQELAYRARRKGLRVRFEPSARVMHIGDHSLSKRQSSTERAARVARAELAFLSAHYSRPRAAAIRLITGSAYAVRAVVLALLRRPERAAIYRTMAREYAGPTSRIAV